MKSKRYRAWIAEALSIMIIQPRLREPFRTTAQIHVRLNIRTNADVTNRIKPLEDMLVRAGIMFDDNIVTRFVIERDQQLEMNRCLVTCSGY